MSKWGKMHRHTNYIRERRAKSNNGLRFFRFPAGRTVLRVLPAASSDEEENWFLYVGYHYSVNPASKAPIVCRRETHRADEECPICDVVQELRTSGDNDHAGKLAARRRYIVRAIVRGEEDKGPQIVDMPVTVFEAMADVMDDMDTWGDMLDIRRGRDVIVTKKGSGLSTEYSLTPHPKQSPILKSKNAVLEMLDNLGKMDDLVTVPSLEEVEKILHAIDEDEEEGSNFAAPQETVDEDDSWDDEEDDDGSEPVEADPEDVPFDPDDEEESDADDESEDAADEEEEWIDDDEVEIEDPADSLEPDEDDEEDLAATVQRVRSKSKTTEKMDRVRGKISNKVGGKAAPKARGKGRRKSA